jgi:hypothetical protein
VTCVPGGALGSPPSASVAPPSWAGSGSAAASLSLPAPASMTVSSADGSSLHAARALIDKAMKLLDKDEI